MDFFANGLRWGWYFWCQPLRSNSPTPNAGKGMRPYNTPRVPRASSRSLYRG